MKQLLLALALGLALVGCAGPKGDAGSVGASGPQGNQGDQGVAGSNGHSLVSETVAASALECAVSGQRLDIYVDLDDSLSVSAGDQFQSSLIACNGANGLNGQDGAAGAQGPQGDTGPQGSVGPQGGQGVAGPSGPAGVQGPQGEAGAQGPAGTGATVQNYSLSSSTCTSLGDSLYAKKNSTNVRIYSGSTCSSSTMTLEIDSSGHSYFLTGTRVGFNVNGGDLRILKFN